MEYVEAVVTITKNGERGKLELNLTSPQGTVSPILGRRNRDWSDKGFTKWPFSSVFHWDEKPAGNWTLLVRDHTDTYGKLVSWKLRFYGTCEGRAMCDTGNKKSSSKTFYQGLVYIWLNPKTIVLFCSLKTRGHMILHAFLSYFPQSPTILRLLTVEWMSHYVYQTTQLS